MLVKQFIKAIKTKETTKQIIKTCHWQRGQSQSFIAEEDEECDWLRSVLFTAIFRDSEASLLIFSLAFLAFFLGSVTLLLLFLEAFAFNFELVLKAAWD